MAATPQQREVFSRALKRARSLSGVSQRELARRMDVSPGSVSQWEGAEAAPRPQLATRLEQELELEDGALGRLLGYLPASVQEEAAVSVLDAVERDPRLGERERELLASMYEQLVRQRRVEQRSE